MSDKKNNFQKPELSVEELSHALYHANLKLNAANQKLRQQEKQRLEFYANISHDLRAPITALSSSIEYMLACPELPSQEINENLVLMQKRIVYLEHLINDIFLLSSLDSSDSKVHKEEVDMRFLLEDYFYMCEEDSHYSNAELHLNIVKDLDVTLSVDPILIQRVLDNLFTNALKYSKGVPYIELGAYIEGSELVIYVADHGIGISRRNIEKIFERSYTVQKSRTPGSDTGSGFGLSITALSPVKVSPKKEAALFSGFHSDTLFNNRLVRNFYLPVAIFQNTLSVGDDQTCRSGCESLKSAYDLLLRSLIQ